MWFTYKNWELFSYFKLKQSSLMFYLQSRIYVRCDFTFILLIVSIRKHSKVMKYLERVHRFIHSGIEWRDVMPTFRALHHCNNTVLNIRWKYNQHTIPNRMATNSIYTRQKFQMEIPRSKSNFKANSKSRFISLKVESTVEVKPYECFIAKVLNL